jgi:hypothetical protein
MNLFFVTSGLHNFGFKFRLISSKIRVELLLLELSRKAITKNQAAIVYLQQFIFISFSNIILIYYYSIYAGYN